MMLTDTRMPPIGFAALSRQSGSGPLGSMFSRAFKKVSRAVSDAFSDIADEAKRTWDRVRAEARRAGSRVGDTVEKAVRDVASRDWWANTVARTVSRVAAARLLVAVASFVYPPVALIAQGIQEFLARWKAEEVGTTDFWAVARKDEVNVLLAEVVVEVNKIDLFQTLPTLALTELTIQAQDSRSRRDSLRVEVAEIQAKWATTEWAVVAKHVFEAAQMVVVGVVTLGAGNVLIAGAEVAIQAIIELGRTLISAATTVLQIQQMREFTKIAKERQREARQAEEQRIAEEMRRMQAEIDALNAEIAAMGGQPVDGATVEDVAAAEGLVVAPGWSPAKIGAAIVAAGALAYAAST